jgi:hypothetical protein
MDKVKVGDKFSIEFEILKRCQDDVFFIGTGLKRTDFAVFIDKKDLLKHAKKVNKEIL